MYRLRLTCVDPETRVALELSDDVYEDMTPELEEQVQDTINMSLANVGNVCEELYNSGHLVHMLERKMLPNGDMHHTDIRACGNSSVPIPNKDVEVAEATFNPLAPNA